MDPVSAIGLAGSVVGIVDILAKRVNFLLNLQAKCKPTDLTVGLLIRQLSTLKAALNQICERITSRLLAVPQHEQLVLDLTVSIKSCKVLVSALDDRINSFDRNAAHPLNTLSKAQFLWEENGTTDYLNRLGNQISALNLLLTALQCRSLFEQRNLLQSEESRRTVRLVEDNMSSLLLLSNENSHHCRLSISTENSQELDTMFDFDREIFNSKAYQAAISSKTRQALSKKADTVAQPERSPLENLTKAFDHVHLGDNDDAPKVGEECLSPLSSRDHVQLDDKKDTQTVREERLGTLSSKDELLDELIGAKRANDSIATITNNIDLDIQKSPVKSSLHDSLPLSDDVTDHKIKDSTNLAFRWPTPASRLGTLRNLRTLGHLPRIRAVTTRKVAQRRLSFLPNRINSRTSSVLAAVKRSRNEKRKASPKISIFGTSYSGKSTLLNSMKLSLHGNEIYSHVIREKFKGVIFTHIIWRMRTILEAMDRSEIPLKNQENEQHIKTIFMQPAEANSGPLDPDLALAIKALWSDNGVREHSKSREVGQLNSSCSYYFDSISRIALPDYVPTNEDILRTWVKTTGITETVFRWKRHTCRIFDVGGSRPERKKWIHVCHNTAVVLFLVDISDYDQSLYEEGSANKMQESLTLFDSICKSRFFFGNTPIVLFFTKIDCLETKLATSPFNEYFPEFTGDSTSLQDVKAYITMRFLSLDQDSNREIDVYFTNLVSEISPGRTTIAAIEKILDKLKREKGLIRKTSHFIQSLVGDQLI